MRYADREDNAGRTGEGVVGGAKVGLLIVHAFASACVCRKESIVVGVWRGVSGCVDR